MDSPISQMRLRDYLEILRRRKVVVAAVTLVVLGVVAAYTVLRGPSYQGQAEILVQPVPNVLGTSGNSPGVTALNMDTEAALARSEAVANRVRANLGLSATPKSLLNKLTVGVITNTDILTVAYTASSPTPAAALANGFAQAYIDFRKDQVLAQLDLATSSVQRQIAAIKSQFVPGLLTALQQRLVDLQTAASVIQGSQLVARAVPPASSTGTGRLRDAVLALVVGLVLGSAAAFTREAMDDRVRGPEDLERRLDIPVVAVPQVRGWRKPRDGGPITAVHPTSPVSESYRTLSADLDMLALHRNLQVLMVTSAGEGEGKTTTAANLGVVLAQAGKRVIIISADLRRPRIHQHFQLNPNGGLGSLGNGSGPLPDLAHDSGIPGLKVIPSERSADPPVRVLATPSTKELFEWLRQGADFIIVDSPEIIGVADVTILAPLIDGALLVVDARRCTRSELSRARAQLQRAEIPLVAAVLNRYEVR